MPSFFAADTAGAVAGVITAVVEVEQQTQPVELGLAEEEDLLTSRLLQPEQALSLATAQYQAAAQTPTEAPRATEEPAAQATQTARPATRARSSSLTPTLTTQSTAPAGTGGYL